MRRALLSALLIVIAFFTGCIKHQPPNTAIADPTIIMQSSLSLEEVASLPEPFWYGGMVVDMMNHRIAFLPWNGEVNFSTDGAVVVEGVDNGTGSIVFNTPFPSLFRGVILRGGKVAAVLTVSANCTVLVPAIAYQGWSGYSVQAGGISGTAYKAAWGGNADVYTIGDCSHLQ
ncbi:MAG: hypothetical protein HY565_03625 [Candidatus Kerfeldbacteria bacterium]|nr:hypothetical protein [Candidatus Kerfeldbacteria bacterium]